MVLKSEATRCENVSITSSIDFPNIDRSQTDESFDVSNIALEIMQPEYMTLAFKVMEGLRQFYSIKSTQE